jgi:hypothetical protein
MIPSHSTHRKEDSIYVFPETKLRGRKGGGLIMGIYKSLTDTVHECRNWEQCRAVSFLGIFVSNLRYSVFAVYVEKTYRKRVRMHIAVIQVHGLMAYIGRGVGWGGGGGSSNFLKDLIAFLQTLKSTTSAKSPKKC